MNVEQNPRDRQPPRVIIEDYERLLTTRKRYGNNSEESEGEIIEAYNDLLFMILQLLFSMSRYILKDFKNKISSKMDETQDETEQARLQTLLSKVNKSISKVNEISHFDNMIKVAKRKDTIVMLITLIVGIIIMESAMLGSGIIIEGLSVAFSAIMYSNGGLAISSILIRLTGIDSIYENKVKDKYRLYFVMCIKALHKLLQIVFNSENSIKIVDLKDRNMIDWGIFNNAQIELILTRNPPKIIKKLSRDQICPICQECINPNNYYDNPSGQTNEESQTKEEKEKEAECKSGESKVYFDEKAEQLLCGHRFHTKCIDLWENQPKNELTGITRPKNNICPYCREPLHRHKELDYKNKSFDSNQGGERMYSVKVRDTADLHVGPDGMKDMELIHFLGDLLSLYYEPGRFISATNQAAIARLEKLGQTPNKPAPRARPFTHKEKSAINVTAHSITGKGNENGTFNKFRDSYPNGFGSNTTVGTKSGLYLRPFEGGKRNTRKYKGFSRK